MGILQEIFLSLPFLKTKILKRRLLMLRSQTVFADKGNSGIRFGHLFIVLSQIVLTSSFKPISSSRSLIVHYRTTAVNLQSFIIFAVNAEACKEFLVR